MRLRAALLVVAAAASAQQIPQASLSGIVRGADGEPLGHTDVILLPGPCQRALHPALYTLTTGTDGRFSFDSVLPGDCYLLQLIHRDYPAMQYPDRGWLADNAGFTLAPGQHFTGLDIRLTRAILSGKVTNAAGEPMAGVTVRALVRSSADAAPFANSMTQTDAAGSYKLADLTPGSYFLAYTPAGGSGITTYYPKALALQGAAPVMARNGEEQSGLDMQLQEVPVFHIRGKITGLASNVNLAAGEARLFPVAAGGDIYPAQNNPGRRIAPDGSFDYGGLAAGEYTVILTAHEQVLAQRAIHVADHDLNALSIAAQPVVMLSGVLHTYPELPEGSFTPDLFLKTGVVRLVPLDPAGRPISGQIKPDGTFSIAYVGASQYLLKMDLRDSAYVHDAALAGKTALGGLDFRHDAPAAPLQISIGLRSSRLSGTIKNAAGLPVPAMIFAIAAKGPAPEHNGYLQTSAGPSGQFALRLPPGDYRLYAWEDSHLGDFVVQAEFLKLFEAHSVAVTLEDGDQRRVGLTLISHDQIAAALRHGW